MNSEPTATKPSIVFCHGIWADGSSFSKVIPALQADGHEVIAAQYGLDTFAGDVATVKPTLGRVSSPAFLVGHSYGGSVITAAGMDDRVAGLVYIAALAPAADETSQSQLTKFPVADGDFVIVHGRYSGIGIPVNWIVADMLRIENGILVEHWDVIEDEAMEEQSKSKAPMFGSSFPIYSKPERTHG